MIRKLRLYNFKSFREAELILGPFTMLVGTNASGKSNLRDAFRFLHGIGRGYSLAEVIGEKYGEGGVLQWRGIRGGTREIGFQGAEAFALELDAVLDYKNHASATTYRIKVEIGQNGQGPVVSHEYLAVDGAMFFETAPVSTDDPVHIRTRVRKTGQGRYPLISFIRQQSILSQCSEDSRVPTSIREAARSCMALLSNMRFLDLHPDAMRQASFPGQTILGDRGENLSSVLQSICINPERKQILLGWLQELTPMDAADFDFPADQIGRILVSLVEEDGTHISAYSASDGTLRFLGMLAALLGPDSTQFYFFEEIENGIHPTRLHLLLQLIEQQSRRANIQIVATTHSPQLLRLVSTNTLDYVSLTYRLQGQGDAHIKRVLDIPEAQRIINEQDLAHLHESGWLEDAVYFAPDDEVATKR